MHQCFVDNFFAHKRFMVRSAYTLKNIFILFYNFLLVFAYNMSFHQGFDIFSKIRRNVVMKYSLQVVQTTHFFYF